VLYRGERKTATDLCYQWGGGAVIGGTATAGYHGAAIAGDYGTAAAGDYGTATAGYHGAAIAGFNGTATAGLQGTATAGVDGTATAGVGGVVSIKWRDGNRCRLAVGYVGENGIEPDVPYRVVGGILTPA